MDYLDVMAAMDEIGEALFLSGQKPDEIRRLLRDEADRVAEELKRQEQNGK